VQTWQCGDLQRSSGSFGGMLVSIMPAGWAAPGGGREGGLEVGWVDAHAVSMRGRIFYLPLASTNEVAELACGSRHSAPSARGSRRSAARLIALRRLLFCQALATLLELRHPHCQLSNSARGEAAFAGELEQGSPLLRLGRSSSG